MTIAKLKRHERCSIWSYKLSDFLLEIFPSIILNIFHWYELAMNVLKESDRCVIAVLDDTLFICP